MLTKALIKELPEEGSNIFKIRVPLFEDTTGSEIIYNALYCYPPGIYGGLDIGDCVYVAFEDDKLNIPVILGKLYTGTTDEDYVFANINNLSVSSQANLPDNTMLGDSVSFNTIYNMMQRLFGVDAFDSNYYLIGDSEGLGQVDASDSEGIIGYYSVNGYICSGRRTPTSAAIAASSIVADFTLPKKIDSKVKYIKCTEYNVKIRSVDGYISWDPDNLGAFADYSNDTNKIICTPVSADSPNVIRVQLVRTRRFCKSGDISVSSGTATNNVPVSIVGSFKFQFLEHE